jgi:predicted metal-binding protein
MWEREKPLDPVRNETLIPNHCAHSLVTKKLNFPSVNFSRNQLCIMMELLTGHYHLKGNLFKLGLENGPDCNNCNRCKRASVMASHIHCGCQALGILRLFRQLGGLFIQPGDYKDISVSMILHFVQSGGGT